MKENRFRFLLTGLLCFGAVNLCFVNYSRAQDANIATAHSLDELRAQITTHIEAPRFSGALWGIKIASLDSGKVLFESHPDRLMSPASNSKMYPSALALDRFGGDYRIVTPILATAKPDKRGTIHGDLVISGRGDPSWSELHMATNFSGLFTPFITALKNAGVKRVTGDLIGDTTFFHALPNGGSWTVDDLADSEGAEISALTLNDNFTTIHIAPAKQSGKPCELTIEDPFTGLTLDNQTTTTTNGGPHRIETQRFRGENVVHIFGALPVGGKPELVEMPMLRPAQWFTSALRDALKQNGIRVDGAARVVAWPATPTTASEKIGEVTSPPLRELVRNYLKPSQNLETDLIFDHTGETTRTAETPTWVTSEQLALIALDAFLKTNDLPAEDVHFDEGSGLSRNNLTTANASVALLQFMFRGKESEDYQAALPIAGVDGTLRRRMKNTAAYENVHAKTGTLHWVNSLSGFVTTAAGEKLVFSLMLNRYDAPENRKRTDELDDIAVMLAQFTGRSDAVAANAYASLGTLVVTNFASAPFPHPSRAHGRTRNGQYYSAEGHYADSTVAMFIPKGFRVTDKVDFVVHFHGWGNTVAGTLEQYNLPQQFCDSGKNAILIIPEGPHNAPDSAGGKLEETNGFAAFMAEAMEKLKASGALGTDKFEMGDVIISGHSGGYHVMGEIVNHGGLPAAIKEAWLFDALYGNTDDFVGWQKEQKSRLVNIYTDHGGTKGETERLMGEYKKQGVSFEALEETNTAPSDLAKEKLTFIHTDLTHNETVFRRGEYTQYLKTSCLKDK
ncbi:MAG TPA: D-alanyl-D-alanine carboxypeptidase/D-alanyl-D-alanine-endopeptidase [Verrucomicrobiae bacterium]|nr:D-alanyl-D-alanine carboxypeptidase/D-alanyl-D-alanine-endopeptidase [Verrucomicrobiae bacterium]